MTGSNDTPETDGHPPRPPDDGHEQAGDRSEQPDDTTEQGGESADRRDPDSQPPEAPDDPAVCGYCGARFVDGELLALHRGLEHGSRLDEAEREAYAEAVADEREALRLFRLQALVALLVIYFGFVLVYAFVL